MVVYPKDHASAPNYSLFISTISLGQHDSSIFMYADDSIICHQSLDITQLNEAINNNIEKLELRIKGNKLSLRAVKTQSMPICTRQQRFKCLRDPGPKTSAGPLFFTISIFFLRSGPLFGYHKLGARGHSPPRPPFQPTLVQDKRFFRNPMQ